MGYHDKEIKNDPNEWFKRIHPEDYENVIQEIEEHFCGKSVHFINEHRILHKDGTYCWVLMRGIAIRDQANQPYRMAGSLTDITERKNNENRITASLKEKEVLLQEIHHRVKNNMQVISSLLRLQNHYVQDQYCQTLLKESQNRIRSMSLVHEKLYQSGDLTKIECDEYLEQLIQYLMRSYTIQPDKIELRTEIAKLKLEIDTAIPCGLVINELVSNALKYAFPGDAKGVITVSMYSLAETGELEFVVEDNGIGLPDEYRLEDSQTLGLQLVSILVKDQLHGEVEISGSPGTRFRIRFREVKSC